MHPYRKRPFKKRKPKTLSQIILLTFVTTVLSIIFAVWIINEGIEPTLMDIAEVKVGQFAREAINEAVSKRLNDDLDIEQLIQMETNDDGNIVSLGWNSRVINRVLRNATFRVQNYLKRLERGERPIGDSLDFDLEEDRVIESDEEMNNEAVVRIPIGQATQNSLLANLGPRVPVHFSVVGDVQPDFITHIEEYGINNALINLVIEIKVNVQIVIPFSTSTTEVTTTIPVDTRIVQGLVPEFYGAGGSNSPNISIPYSRFSESGNRGFMEGESGLQD
ncbi:sporulation protein YunB [Tenuibacillus multivorans]|uniref:Sporulation protein YunB n=1 Tax=Tenuibacillus multivorans TaxID=237069 RepID=A0A1H0FUE4_9BACI|nr:sporulation protein YunB [Tenuibacillus multivorans]GEL77872.1 sporulation protein YunB [Tenuibacillus multivorans]SDN98276.1 sporulation protein YunB [Tenuibacillus multivorans]